jgi:hypothetical protein
LQIVDMRFLSPSSNVLASCDDSGVVIVRRIYEEGPSGAEATIKVKKPGCEEALGAWINDWLARIPGGSICGWWSIASSLMHLLLKVWGVVLQEEVLAMTCNLGPMSWLNVRVVVVQSMFSHALIVVSVVPQELPGLMLGWSCSGGGTHINLGVVCDSAGGSVGHPEPGAQ